MAIHLIMKLITDNCDKAHWLKFYEKARDPFSKKVA